ncbi:MAG: hypothetical protein HW405_609 [Candidatus Berkelbacteria bacterium]|nr:hypothetical protein [Candidatus Berkelbacteria bacterium]
MRHKCIGSILVFLLFFSIIFLLSFSQMKMLLQAKTLLQVLDQAKIYNNLDQISQEIINNSDSSTSSWDKVVIRAYAKSFNPVWMKTTAETNLPLIFDFASGKTVTVNASINLLDFKKELTKNFVTTTQEEVKNMPTCQNDEIPPEETVLTCIPQGTSASQVSSMIVPSDFTEVINKIPDTLIINEKNHSIVSLKQSFTLLNIFFFVSLITSILLIIILVLLNLSYWPSILRWVGLGLILPSSFVFILNLMSAAVRTLIRSQIQSALTPTTAQILNPIMASIDQNLTRPGLIMSGIVLTAAALMIILSYVIPHPPLPQRPIQKPAPTPQPIPSIQ